MALDALLSNVLCRLGSVGQASGKLDVGQGMCALLIRETVLYDAGMYVNYDKPVTSRRIRQPAGSSRAAYRRARSLTLKGGMRCA